MSSKTSIVFLGSGPVAAESLRLLQEDFRIEAVITKPTTEKEMASVAKDAPLFTVSTRLELDVLIEQQMYSSKVGVIIDFGIIVSQKTIDSFERGIINSHFSLLPELRGADPISFAILDGRQKTGVSLMLLVEAMDEGPLLGFGELVLNGSETTPSLTDDLVRLSNSLLTELLDKYIDGSITISDQTGEPSYTRKLTKSDGSIDWSKAAVILEREIRGYAGWPKSRTTIESIDCVVTGASVLNEKATGEPGSLFIHNKKLAIVCGENALVIETIKPAGKKEMDSIGFLNGYRNRLGV
jgi:methionyl-tRNA formyltransferase